MPHVDVVLMLKSMRSNHGPPGAPTRPPRSLYRSRQIHSDRCWSAALQSAAVAPLVSNLITGLA
jgi:hypothetical protein